MRKDAERYKTFDDWAKGVKEKDGLLGKKGIAEPLGKDATPEQRAERAALVRRANAAPESPEGYQLARPEGIPEQLWDTNAVADAAKIAHKYGLPQDALKEFADFQVQMGKKAIEADNALRTEWLDGQDKLIRAQSQKEGMNYAEAKENAERAGRKFGIDPNNPGMKNASLFLAMARVGKAMQEGTMVKGEPEKLENMSSASALARMNDIKDNPANPKNEAYWQRKGPHPDHDAVVAEARALSAIAYRDRPQRATERRG